MSSETSFIANANSVHYHTQNRGTLVYQIEHASEYGIKLAQMPSRTETLITDTYFAEEHVIARPETSKIITPKLCHQLPSVNEELVKLHSIPIQKVHSENVIKSASMTLINPDSQYHPSTYSIEKGHPAYECDFYNYENHFRDGDSLSDEVEEYFVVNEDFEKVLEETDSVFEELNDDTIDDNCEISDEKVRRIVGIVNRHDKQNISGWPEQTEQQLDNSLKEFDCATPTETNALPQPDLDVEKILNFSDIHLPFIFHNRPGLASKDKEAPPDNTLTSGNVTPVPEDLESIDPSSNSPSFHNDKNSETSETSVLVNMIEDYVKLVRKASREFNQSVEEETPQEIVPGLNPSPNFSEDFNDETSELDDFETREDEKSESFTGKPEIGSAGTEYENKNNHENSSEPLEKVEFLPVAPRKSSVEKWESVTLKNELGENSNEDIPKNCSDPEIKLEINEKIHTSMVSGYCNSFESKNAGVDSEFIQDAPSIEDNSYSCFLHNESEDDRTGSQDSEFVEIENEEEEEVQANLDHMGEVSGKQEDFLEPSNEEPMTKTKEDIEKAFLSVVHERGSNELVWNTEVTGNVINEIQLETPTELISTDTLENTETVSFENDISSEMPADPKINQDPCLPEFDPCQLSDQIFTEISHQQVKEQRDSAEQTTQLSAPFTEEPNEEFEGEEKTSTSQTRIVCGDELENVTDDKTLEGTCSVPEDSEITCHSIPSYQQSSGSSNVNSIIQIDIMKTERLDLPKEDNEETEAVSSNESIHDIIASTAEPDENEVCVDGLSTIIDCENSSENLALSLPANELSYFSQTSLEIDGVVNELLVSILDKVEKHDHNIAVSFEEQIIEENTCQIIGVVLEQILNVLMTSVNHGNHVLDTQDSLLSAFPTIFEKRNSNIEQFVHEDITPILTPGTPNSTNSETDQDVANVVEQLLKAVNHKLYQISLRPEDPEALQEIPSISTKASEEFREHFETPTKIGEKENEKEFELSDELHPDISSTENKTTLDVSETNDIELIIKDLLESVCEQLKMENKANDGIIHDQDLTATVSTTDVKDNLEFDDSISELLEYILVVLELGEFQSSDEGLEDNNLDGDCDRSYAEDIANTNAEVVDLLEFIVEAVCEKSQNENRASVPDHSNEVTNEKNEDSEHKDLVDDAVVSTLELLLEKAELMSECLDTVKEEIVFTPEKVVSRDPDDASCSKAVEVSESSSESEVVVLLEDLIHSVCFGSNSNKILDSTVLNTIEAASGKNEEDLSCSTNCSLFERKVVERERFLVDRKDAVIEILCSLLDILVEQETHDQEIAFEEEETNETRMVLDDSGFDEFPGDHNITMDSVVTSSTEYESFGNNERYDSLLCGNPTLLDGKELEDDRNQFPIQEEEEGESSENYFLPNEFKKGEPPSLSVGGFDKKSDVEMEVTNEVDLFETGEKNILCSGEDISSVEFLLYNEEDYIQTISTSTESDVVHSSMLSEVEKIERACLWLKYVEEMVERKCQDAILQAVELTSEKTVSQPPPIRFSEPSVFFTPEPTITHQDPEPLAPLDEFITEFAVTSVGNGLEQNSKKSLWTEEHSGTLNLMEKTSNAVGPYSKTLFAQCQETFGNGTSEPRDETPNEDMTTVVHVVDGTLKTTSSSETPVSNSTEHEANEEETDYHGLSYQAEEPKLCQYLLDTVDDNQNYNGVLSSEQISFEQSYTFPFPDDSSKNDDGEIRNEIHTTNPSKSAKLNTDVTIQLSGVFLQKPSDTSMHPRFLMNELSNNTGRDEIEGSRIRDLDGVETSKQSDLTPTHSENFAELDTFSTNVTGYNSTENARESSSSQNNVPTNFHGETSSTESSLKSLEQPSTSLVLKEVSHFFSTACVAAMVFMSPSESASPSFNPDIIEDASKYFTNEPSNDDDNK